MVLRRRTFASLCLSGLLTCFVTMSSAGLARAEIFPPDSRRPVHTLDANDRYRLLARPIGTLVTDVDQGDGTIRHGLCTAAVISATEILTASFCADPMAVKPGAGQRIQGGEGKRIVAAVLQLGMINPLAPGEGQFTVNPVPLELNHDLGYAVLGVEGNPAAIFGTALLFVRPPRPADKLVLIQAILPTTHGTNFLTVADSCEVKGPMDGDGYVPHDCDTDRGSAGSLLFAFSESDQRYFVLGLHSVSAAPQGRPFNGARSMRDIAAASPIVSSLALIRDPVVQGSGKRFTVNLDGDIPPGIAVNAVLRLNGREIKVERVDPGTRAITFLGDESALQPGMNALDVAARQFLFFKEEKVLSAFEAPYKRSHAIIAAIDGYDRTRSGFEKLEGMVDRAKELKAALIDTGFPAENIQTFFDHEATRERLDDALAEFWQGGKFTDADRLLFYFGGHGAGEPGSAYLVTYDLDPVRPTRTGFLMADFTGRQFPNIRARHVLVALDSCSAGLALPGMKTQNGGMTTERLARFAKLNRIREDTEEKARNILVAGTGEQEALAATGGVFTQALIAGLRSEADLISDGIIQFDELALYIKDRVNVRAAAANRRQSPDSFVDEIVGKGKVLFMPGRR